MPDKEVSMENIAEVKIADDVIAVIAGLAATEVEGVESMSGDLTHELIAKLGAHSLSKGVSLDIKDKEVVVTLSIIIKYGYSVKEVSKKVQDKVKTAIENMTGFTVSGVHINIAGMEN
jgi:uncharacterized alkaline shock family protein YloU